MAGRARLSRKRRRFARESGRCVPDRCGTGQYHRAPIGRTIPAVLLWPVRGAKGIGGDAVTRGAAGRLVHRSQDRGGRQRSGRRLDRLQRSSVPGVGSPRPGRGALAWRAPFAFPDPPGGAGCVRHGSGGAHRSSGVRWRSHDPPDRPGPLSVIARNAFLRPLWGSVVNGVVTPRRRYWTGTGRARRMQGPSRQGHRSKDRSGTHPSVTRGPR